MRSITFFHRKHFLIDFFILTIIILSPFLFFFYTIFPQDVLSWKTSLFTLESNMGYYLKDLFWIFSYKILALIIFNIWFLTCKHWWRYILLMPICIEFHKFFGLLNEEIEIIHNYSFLHSLILCIPIIFLLFIVSKKFDYYSSRKSLNNELNDEIDSLMLSLSKFKNKNYKEFKQKLIALRRDKNKLEHREYLKQLIQLREEFTSQST